MSCSLFVTFHCFFLANRSIRSTCAGLQTIWSFLNSGSGARSAASLSRRFESTSFKPHPWIHDRQKKNLALESCSTPGKACFGNLHGVSAYRELLAQQFCIDRDLSTRLGRKSI